MIPVFEQKLTGMNGTQRVWGLRTFGLGMIFPVENADQSTSFIN
jgi:hypothetical protein